MFSNSKVIKILNLCLLISVFCLSALFMVLKQSEAGPLVCEEGTFAYTGDYIATINVCHMSLGVQCADCAPLDVE